MPNRSAPNTSHELPFRNEMYRKALHLVALLVPLGMYVLGRDSALLILTPLTFLAVCLDIARFYSRTCAGIISAVFGRMMRPEEWETNVGFRLNGATWVLVSATLLTFIFPINIAAAAFATFMVADASAAIIGRIFGQTFWPGSSRTLEGSLAFFAVACVLLVLVPASGIVAACLAAGIGAAAEGVTFPLNDNLRVPILMAATLWGFELFM